jgi:hypothetical protein
MVQRPPDAQGRPAKVSHPPLARNLIGRNLSRVLGNETMQDRGR